MLSVAEVVLQATVALVAASSLLMGGCNAFDDQGGSSRPPSFAGASNPAGIPAGFGGTMAARPVSPPSAGMPQPPQKTEPPPPTGMCFECAPGCLDCGFGCDCFMPPETAPQAWMPPFDSLGEDGWREGTDTFCGGMQNTWSTDVYADERGVFVLVSGQAPGIPTPVAGEEDGGVEAATMQDPLDNPFVPMAIGWSRLWSNDGTGWVLTGERVGGNLTNRLEGFPDGDLVAHTAFRDPFDSCPLGMFHGSRFECINGIDPIFDVAIVGPDKAYAIMAGTRLLTYDGATWHGLGLIPYPVLALWADEAQIVAVGSAGTVLRMQVGQREWVLEDIGSFEQLTAVWGTSGEDLWMGTASGKILHYDGFSWTERAQLGGVTCGTVYPVMGIWGTKDVVYFHTQAQLVRFADGAFETLGNWTCSLTTTQAIRGLSGRSADEVFVVVSDSAPGDECGPAYVAYFDGTQFHRM